MCRVGLEMGSMESLRNRIEEVRKELNQQIVTQDYEVYYEKSVELDQLISEYVELEAQLSA